MAGSLPKSPGNPGKLPLMTFAHRIIGFNSNLKFEEPLPEGIRIMNPFAENPDAFRISSLFYRKYYSDNFPGD